MTITEDLARGLGVGGMFAIGVAAFFLFWIGSYLEGLGSASGAWIMVASGIGIVTAWVTGKAVAIGQARRAAIACVAQACTAVALLVWWTATDAWHGFRYTGTVPLVAVLVLDAMVLVWAVGAPRAKVDP